MGNVKTNDLSSDKTHYESQYLFPVIIISETTHKCEAYGKSSGHFKKLVVQIMGDITRL